MDDNDDYENAYEDVEVNYEPEMRDEAKAFERAGMMGLGRTSIGDKTLDELQKRMWRGVALPMEEFLIKINAVSHAISDDFPVSPNDIEKLTDMARRINFGEYKNPLGYILGFVATGGGYKLNEEVLKRIFKALPKMTDKVVKEDVIKYARLWLNIKK